MTLVYRVVFTCSKTTTLLYPEKGVISMEKYKNCKNCGAKFEVMHGNSKFCSDPCFQSFFKNYRHGWQKENPQVERNYTKSGKRAYLNIKQRCGNPRHSSFHQYGGRGIQLSLSFEEFQKIYFKTDVCENCGIQLDDKNRAGKQGRTLDRIDSNDHYRKGNLRILCRSCNVSFGFKRRKNK
jgi:hypothetical protein